MPTGPKDSVVQDEREALGQESTLPLYPDHSGAPPNHTMLAAFTTLWLRRRTVLRAGLVGLLSAGLLAFLISPKYESTIRLMPPDASNSVAMAFLASKGGEGLSSLASELTGVKSSGSLFIGILRSWRLEDRLINSFQLRKVYRVSLLRDAREKLADNTEISEDRKSGIISVTVTDTSPERAQGMAHAYVEELNRLNAQLSTTAAHKEREFLEGRLQAVKNELDAASKELSIFSSQTSMLDVSEQGKAMVTAASSVEGELIATEAQLGFLRQIYTENNYRIRALQGRANALHRQIEKLQGSPGEQPLQDSSVRSGNFPTIRQLPVLGLRYYDLLRRVKIQETVYGTLTAQFELAKVSEAKETPVVKVLDPANFPEWKSSPHRLFMTLGGLCLGFFISSVYLLTAARWRELESDHPAKLLERKVRKGLAEDYTYLGVMFHRVRSRLVKPNGAERD